MKVSVCLWFAFLLLQSSASSQPVSAKSEKDPFAKARKDVERISVKLDGKKLALNPQPLYAFDDSTRSWKDASSWVWGKPGRPAALMGMSSLRGAVRYNEYASFSTKKLEVDTGFGVKWTPKPAWKPKPIPGAPKPAESARARLSQMRRLARQFEAKQFEPGDDKGYYLRLLPSPIYRYSESKESLDGAFFAFVREQDFETVLCIDAEKQKDGTSRWVYDCKQQSGNSQKVFRKKEEVWSCKQKKRGPESPYFIFVRRLNSGN